MGIEIASTQAEIDQLAADLPEGSAEVVGRLLGTGVAIQGWTLGVADDGRLVMGLGEWGLFMGEPAAFAKQLELLEADSKPTQATIALFLMGGVLSGELRHLPAGR